MDENEKKQLTTEETLQEELREHLPGASEDDVIYLVDVLIDLIAERSEEKAEEIVDKHERDYDHNRLY